MNHLNQSQPTRLGKRLVRLVDSLVFNKDGLVPVIVQDYKSNKVLMLAYANKEAVLETLHTKKAHFYSRSRKKIWLKGEQSGNFQIVKEILYDCDKDCILLRVLQKGDASCHTGYRSCFFSKVLDNGKTKIIEKKIFDPKKVYKLK